MSQEHEVGVKKVQRGWCAGHLRTGSGARGQRSCRGRCLVAQQAVDAGLEVALLLGGFLCWRDLGKLCWRDLGKVALQSLTKGHGDLGRFGLSIANVGINPASSFLGPSLGVGLRGEGLGSGWMFLAPDLYPVAASRPMIVAMAGFPPLGSWLHQTCTKGL